MGVNTNMQKQIVAVILVNGFLLFIGGQAECVVDDENTIQTGTVVLCCR